jgi:hypothetical protein
MRSLAPEAVAGRSNFTVVILAGTSEGEQRISAASR